MGKNHLINCAKMFLFSSLLVMFATPLRGSGLDNQLPDNENIDLTQPRNTFSGTVSDAELQQTGTVSGVVTDANGAAIIGASVIAKGTLNGTVTGLDGRFTLNNVTPGSVLVFSCISYATQEVTWNGGPLNVVLQSDIEMLDELVVVGYGVQRKETLTGSVAQIRSEEIVSTKSPTMASTLQGKVPGLLIRQKTGEPGQFDSMINIRGFGTPLIVIDGVVRDGTADFEKLNPKDIESISVLKDASAAIYGMNASNGVIIVTTKSGNSGKAKFTYSGMVTLKEPTTRNLQKSENAYMLRYMNNEMARNSKLALPTTEEDLAKWAQGDIPGYTDYNWYEECLRDFAQTHEHNFSVQGGSDRISFYTSFGYMNDIGILEIPDLEKYEKYNLRANLTFKPIDGLTAKLSFSGRYDDGTQPVIGYYYLFKRVIVSDRGYGKSPIDNPDHLSNVPPMNSNAWAEMDPETAGYSRKIGMQYQTTLDVNYDLPFVKGLSVGVLGAYDGHWNDNRTLDKAPLLFDYYSDTPNNPALTTYQNTISLYTRLNLQTKINYKKKINRHNINVTLVNDIRKINTNYIQGKRQYDDIFTHDVLAQGSVTNQTTDGTRGDEAYISYVGRFNYDYAGKYLIDFTFRRDGSYRYAPSRRWANFPGVSVGWRVSEEPFIKNHLPFIHNLKLRASWGKMGRDAGSAFQYLAGYSFGGIADGYVLDEGTLTKAMIAPGLVNENLSWIKTTTSNIGLDLDLWNGKLGFSGDYFWRLSEGELATRVSELPNTFGASFPQENLNSSQIKGFDLMVSHRNQVGDWRYSINATMTISRNFYLYREQSPYRSTWSRWKSGTDGDGRIQGRQFLYQESGYQYQSITEYEEDAPLYGTTNGNSYRLPGMYEIIDVNGDGMIDSNDQLATGWVGTGNNPPLQFGSNISVSYKNFDAVIGLQGASLFTVQVARNDNWGYGNRFPVMWSRYMDRWHTVDPKADPFDPATQWIPGKWEALTATTTGNMTSAATSRWRMDATYLRIKSLELGYTLPARWTKKVKLDNVRLYLNAFNLFTFCQEDVRGLDPERNEADNNGTYTVDLTYPLMRSYNFGLEVTF